MVKEVAEDGDYILWFQNRKRYGGMRDYNWLLEYVDWWQLAQFQNRKRYGGMRDSRYRSHGRNHSARNRFKTVNGMEACATIAPTPPTNPNIQPPVSKP